MKNDIWTKNTNGNFDLSNFPFKRSHYFEACFFRMSEAKNKLEKLNNDLEEKLLNVVRKYENEQRELLDQLKLAHTNLVEAKSVINQLEQDRVSSK